MALTGVIDIIKWIGKNLWILIVGIFGILLALLGIERKKVEKLHERISDQEEEIDHHQKQVEVLAVAQQVVAECVEAMTTISQEQEIEAQKIEEAETDEEIIEIHNHIITNFNGNSRK